MDSRTRALAEAVSVRRASSTTCAPGLPDNQADTAQAQAILPAGERDSGGGIEAQDIGGRHGLVDRSGTSEP
jgi:hypothetical protein